MLLNSFDQVRSVVAHRVHRGAPILPKMAAKAHMPATTAILTATRL
jgi:hypothetical protein